MYSSPNVVQHPSMKMIKSSPMLKSIQGRSLALSIVIEHFCSTGWVLGVRIALMQPCMLWRYLVAFNRISVGMLRGSPTNSPMITIGDHLGDSDTHTSIIFVSYITCYYEQFLMRLQIMICYFPYKETNQVIMSFEFGL